MRYQQGTGIIDNQGKKVCSKRDRDLREAFILGAENDLSGFTRLQIESRVSREKLIERYQAGQQSKNSLALKRNGKPVMASEMSRSQSHALVKFSDGEAYHVPLLFWESRRGQFFDQAWGIHLSWH